MKGEVPELEFGYSVTQTGQEGEAQLRLTVMFGSIYGGEGFAAIKLVSSKPIPRALLPEVGEVTAIFSDRENPGTVHALHELAQAMKAEGGEEWIRPEVTYGDDSTLTHGYDTELFSPNDYC